MVGALPPFAEVLATGDVTFAGQQPSVFLCSDDLPAKTEVGRLIADLGCPACWRWAAARCGLVEPAMMLLVTIAYGGDNPRTVGLNLLER